MICYFSECLYIIGHITSNFPSLSCYSNTIFSHHTYADCSPFALFLDPFILPFPPSLCPGSRLWGPCHPSIFDGWLAVGLSNWKHCRDPGEREASGCVFPPPSQLLSCTIASALNTSATVPSLDPFGPRPVELLPYFLSLAGCTPLVHSFPSPCVQLCRYIFVMSFSSSESSRGEFCFSLEFALIQFSTRLFTFFFSYL